MSDLFLYVQHLLGIGHLRRAGALANACAARGLSVTLASGGRPVANLGLAAGVTLLQLPPYTVLPAEFARLLTAEGEEADEAYRAKRLLSLMQGFREAAPKLLMTELFPFGRRQLRHELLPLLEEARARRQPPRILCSLRDILQKRAEKRRRESLDWALRYYDRVLVHGDRNLIPLQRSFPEAEALEGRLIYTGYIAQSPPEPQQGRDRSGVIVSCGGGAVGRHLLDCALEVCRHRGPALGDWHFLVGEQVSEDRLSALRDGLPAWAKVEANRPDFHALLAGAGLSISQAGYNSVVDLLQADVPAVLVPYAADGETEQPMRAALLGRFAGFAVVSEEALTPGRLDEAIGRALDAGGKPARPPVDLSGAEHSATLLKRALEEAQAHAV